MVIERCVQYINNDYTLKIGDGKGVEVSINNKRYFREGKYFAFYIDLLGQKDLYSRVPEYGFLSDTDVGNKLVAVTSVMTKVFSFSSSFLPRFVEQARSAYELNKNGGYEKYRKMDCRDYERLVAQLEFGTQQYSDSLLFYLRDDRAVASDVFPFCIALLGRLVMEYFPNQLAFRGAVSYDDGWECGENCIYGTILKKLVDLEEKVAVVPRIVIDDDLVKYTSSENQRDIAFVF